MKVVAQLILNLLEDSSNLVERFECSAVLSDCLCCGVKNWWCADCCHSADSAGECWRARWRCCHLQSSLECLTACRTADKSLSCSNMSVELSNIAFTRGDRRRNRSAQPVAATVAPCKRYRQPSPRRSPLGCHLVARLNMFNFEQLSEQLSPRVYTTGNRSKQLCK